MPTYQFHCATCDALFEEKRPYSEAGAPSTCPTCHGQNTRQHFGGFTAVTFDSSARERRSFPAKLARENQHQCSAGHHGAHAH